MNSARRASRSWLLVALVVTLSCSAQEQEARLGGQIETQPPKSPKQPEPLDSVAQEALTKDWAMRTQFAEQGLSFAVHFISEPAYAVRGYRGTGASYDQQIDVSAVLDLAKMGLAEGGTVRIAFSDRAGRVIQQDKTGAYIQNHAFYGQGQNFRFDELSFERLFLGRQLSLNGGFYSMGNDFAGLSYTCNFTNNGHCGHPLGLLYGSGWVDSPTGQWGGRAKWTETSGVYLQAGIYDVTPNRKRAQDGFNVGFRESTGYIVPVELAYSHGKTPDDYPGIYKLGGFYDSSNTQDLAASATKANSRTGAYLEGAQQVWKPRAGSVQGISVFGVATIHDKTTGLFRTYFEAGASWRGIVPSRGNDIASIGWVQADINSRLRRAQQQAGAQRQTDEQIVELNYGVQATPWLLVRPTAQYVVRPSGYSERPNTFVFVLHIQATL